VFHRRRNKRLYSFYPVLNHLDISSSLSVFPNIFLSSTPDLSGEFYGGELIKIFVGISIFLTIDNCRVDLKLHVSHWVWDRFFSEYFDCFCQYHSTTLYTHLHVRLLLSQGQVGRFWQLTNTFKTYQHEEILVL
jgi:hypothetical protein